MCLAPKMPKAPTPAPPPPPPPAKGPEELKIKTAGEVNGKRKKSQQLGASALRIDLGTPTQKGTSGLNIPS